MKTIRQNPYFFIPYLIALAAGAVVLLIFKKGEALLFINRLHTPFFDSLFYYGTSLGNGLFYIAILLLLALIRLEFAALGWISFSITGLLILALKNLVFFHSVRPKIFFEGKEALHYVEGVKILSYFSFPSGHTAMAFSLFCFLSLIIPRKAAGLLLILFALIGGISRIYLTQHFFIDVYFGSVIGVAVSALTYHFSMSGGWFTHKPIWQKSLLSVTWNNRNAG